MTLQTIFTTNPVVHLVRAIIVGGTCLCTINPGSMRLVKDSLVLWTRGCDGRLFHFTMFGLSRSGQNG
jgi:hypothetical protein